MKVAKNTENEGVVSLNHNLTKLDDSSFVRNRMDSSPSEKVSQLKSYKESSTNDASNNDASDNGLPFQLKSGIEQLSGISMDDVKVHRNSDKPAQLQAHAYAQGTDIHIASGQEKYLPHEAWHVVQQKQGRVQPTTMMKAKVPINDDQGLEKEADVMGARALQMKPFSLSDYRTQKSVQRKEIIQRVPKFDNQEEETTPKTVEQLIEFFEQKNKSNVENARQRAKNVNSATRILEAKLIEINKENAKEKEPEKAKKITKLEEDFKSAIEANDAALKATKIAEEAERLAEDAKRLAAETTAAETTAAETAAAEKERLETKRLADAATAEAARIAAENIAIDALKKAETLAEMVGRKLDEYLGGDSYFGNMLEAAAMPGTTMDSISHGMQEGSANRELLEAHVTKGAFVGNLADTCELLTTTAEFFNSEQKPADFALLGITVGKFTIGVVDTINTSMAGGLIGEALSKTVTLLPGIKASLGVFKNGVEIYQTILKKAGLNDLLEQFAIPDTTSKEREKAEKEREIIENYRTTLKWKLGEIGVDFILNAAEAIATIFPPAQVGIALLHASINLFKFGVKQYINHKDNQELKSAERIGDQDVKRLKDEKIEEKSGRDGFKAALECQSRLENYKKDKVNNKKFIELETEKLKALILAMNTDAFPLAEDKITPENLAYFLTLERNAILSIKKEVVAEKTLTERFSNIFNLPQKETIIADLVKNQVINFEKIEEADINNLDPKAKNYFYDKTQESIRRAINRKHISSDERLDMLEKMLLTKFDDYKIRGYMIELYKDKGVYNDADSDKVQFTKSVIKFKKEMK